ncbi:hypothetical protein BV20DRAFT_145539 [Pilatotrama ljubarskyi]|nr:hypothetical protein BV20DRAFT_145539 [Pilatotrama ljubarskyi]
MPCPGWPLRGPPRTAECYAKIPQPTLSVVGFRIWARQNFSTTLMTISGTHRATRAACGRSSLTVALWRVFLGLAFAVTSSLPLRAIYRFFHFWCSLLLPGRAHLRLTTRDSAF